MPLQVVTFKIDPAEYALVKKVAKKQERTVGEYFRIAVADALRGRWAKPAPEKNPDHEALDELLGML
jgi:hypothetical protein